MKKFIAFLALSLFLLCLPISNASAAQTDLLRGLQPEAVGSTVFLNSVGNATDGDDSTYAEAKSNLVDQPYEYKFVLPTPSTIRKIRIKVDNLNSMYPGVILHNTDRSVIADVRLTSTDQTITIDAAEKVKYVLIDGRKNTNLKLFSLEVYSDTLSATGDDGKVYLSWDPFPNATGYNVKRATTQNGPYVVIKSNVIETNFTDTTVTNGTTYYYVINPIVAGAERPKSNVASATPTGTTNPQPTPAPSNLTATAGDTKASLNWTGSTGATYTIKRSLTANGPYTSIASNVTDQSYTDTNVINGTTYYYVVTATVSGAESINSNEASATPNKATNPNPQPTGDRAILTVTMTNGLEKEYDLSASEISSFISWYDAKDSGRGPSLFTVNKGNNNKGPFSARKDFLIFDKILTFEVSEYTDK
ncbi:hypothetical protein [Paenibacillus sp. J22TS3]|uniref:hypothetical protein n=1 Tax=Paenibacillus sp. J22TS3 TaxID=2807192 RepID=UPI001B10D9E1|nr:hypothetical protein [Paenibacillus sp. J22TS3]GIP21044.1 hypothetical protein J22TS3_13190 [Paenibacillus sp. J22TS3]